MDIPANLLVHTVQVETKTGDGAYGETYAATQTLPCFREDGHKLVRTASGDQAVSSMTLYLAPGQAAAFTPGSRVTSGGRDSTVMVAIDHDDAGMGAPQHTEVACE